MHELMKIGGNGPRAASWPGGYRSRWMRAFALRRWRRLWRNMASPRSSTRIRAASSRPSTSSRFWPFGRSRSAWMAKVHGATTSSSKGCGGASSMKRSTFGPIPACPKHAPGSAATSASTTDAAPIHGLTAGRPTKPTSTRCCPSWQRSACRQAAAFARRRARTPTCGTRAESGHRSSPHRGAERNCVPGLHSPTPGRGLPGSGPLSAIGPDAEAWYRKPGAGLCRCIGGATSYRRRISVSVTPSALITSRIIGSASIRSMKLLRRPARDSVGHARICRPLGCIAPVSAARPAPPGGMLTCLPWLQGFGPWAKAAITKRGSREMTASKERFMKELLEGKGRQAGPGRPGADWVRVPMFAAAPSTSCVQTSKSESVPGPKICVSGTSAASRPRATRMRPVRRVLFRGSKTHQRPPRKTSIQAAKSSGAWGSGWPSSLRYPVQ
ncbi:hypothetical protein Salmuc_03828 [Salipiger mucosus DSM 16094]|uniref:Uncharacterized protein n=1 Tax=Salipiger mucosus DSM 16094 TaxID=1123237 RepID=S9QGG2_9RHOB|nr:hypothetical protein Salmuc_03828 [Salipiger mucosus DSM 16094]